MARVDLLAWLRDSVDPQPEKARKDNCIIHNGGALFQVGNSIANALLPPSHLKISERTSSCCWGCYRAHGRPVRATAVISPFNYLFSYHSFPDVLCAVHT